MQIILLLFLLQVDIACKTQYILMCKSFYHPPGAARPEIFQMERTSGSQSGFPVQIYCNGRRHMKNKFLALILTAAIICGAILPSLTLTARAAEVVDSGDCGTNVTWALDSTGTLTISGSGEMHDYDFYETSDLIRTTKENPGMV